MGFLHVVPSTETALGCLPEPARGWFRATFGEPTAAQRLAWPTIAAGENLLLASPTGSGKTLAAFLPILGGLVTSGEGGLRCLYVAPLKALGRDAKHNLRRYCRDMTEAQWCEVGAEESSPLAPLSPWGRGAGGEGARHAETSPAPAEPDRAARALNVNGPRIALRTGDTSPRVRQRQLADPPHVLLTTPESLAVLLTHAHARDFFRTVRHVVIDEVHALAAGKRGADLALSLERIEALADGPVQRVGLSATCSPLETAARFLVGVGRPCRIAEVSDRSELELHVEPLPFEGGPGFMNRLLHRLEPELRRNRTTLIFTNTRSLAERVNWALRERFPEEVERIAVHHSALSAARRRAAERRMKQGRLWAVVSSTSLELGVDVGTVDGVVFVHPPGSTVRLLQRLGRSGHAPGQLRRGLVLTASYGQLVEAAVTAASGRHGQVEPIALPAHPLDVLCQHLAGMAMSGSWTADDVFALVGRAAPYQGLARADFDDCVDYLSGRRPDGTEWLPSRLAWEGAAFTIAGERTARLLRRNLGTILSEEQRAIRLRETPAGPDELERTSLVGEVDEVYADRLQPGDRFMLDGRCLELRERGGTDLTVEEVSGRPLVPVWRGPGVPMSAELAARLYLFRAEAAESLREGPAALRAFLRRDYRLADEAADMLARFVTLQETVSEVPDRDALLVEGLANQGCTEYAVHTPLPRLANEALVRVLTRRLQQRQGLRGMAVVADLGFVLIVERPVAVEPETWRSLLSADGFEDDFAATLAAGPLLRERFAQVAETGLMVLRNPAGRKPKVGGRDWAARELFDQLAQTAPDFVLLRQAQREVRHSACDLTSALAFVNELPRRAVRLRWLAEPSPFGNQLLASHAVVSDGPTQPDEALRRLQADLLKSRAG